MASSLRNSWSVGIFDAIEFRDRASAPVNIERTPEQCARIARLADNLGFPWDAALDEALSLAEKHSPNRIKPGENAYDALVRLGFLGSVEGPEDLSTNPAHREGFGVSKL